MKNKLEINHNHTHGESLISLKETFINAITRITATGLILTIPTIFAYKIYNDFKAVDIPNPVSISINSQVDDMYGFGENGLNYVSRSSTEKMTKLKINLTKGAVDLSFLEAFTNLAELDLVVDHSSWECINSIPELPNLISLKLDNWYVTTPTVLSAENLQFFRKLPKLKNLELDLSSTIIPAGVIEQFCPGLEGITIKHWRNDNILTDLNFFPNLKQVTIDNSEAQSVGIAFSKSDYNKLITKGVNVSIKTNDSIQEYWNQCEKYYNDLHLSSYGNPKEVIDRILAGFIDGSISYTNASDATRILRALTHMAGIEGKYIQGPGQTEQDVWGKHYCLIDVFNSGTYYEFDPQIIIQNNIIASMNNNPTNSIPGYMQNVDAQKYYIEYANTPKGINLGR